MQDETPATPPPTRKELAEFVYGRNAADDDRMLAYQRQVVKERDAERAALRGVLEKKSRPRAGVRSLALFHHRNNHYLYARPDISKYCTHTYRETNSTATIFKWRDYINLVIFMQKGPTTFTELSARAWNVQILARQHFTDKRGALRAKFRTLRDRKALMYYAAFLQVAGLLTGMDFADQTEAPIRPSHQGRSRQYNPIASPVLWEIFGLIGPKENWKGTDEGHRDVKPPAVIERCDKSWFFDYSVRGKQESQEHYEAYLQGCRLAEHMLRIDAAVAARLPGAMRPTHQILLDFMIETYESTGAHPDTEQLADHFEVPVVDIDFQLTEMAGLRLTHPRDGAINGIAHKRDTPTSKAYALTGHFEARKLGFIK